MGGTRLGKLNQNLIRFGGLSGVDNRLRTSPQTEIDEPLIVGENSYVGFFSSAVAQDYWLRAFWERGEESIRYMPGMVWPRVDLFLGEKEPLFTGREGRETLVSFVVY